MTYYYAVLESLFIKKKQVDGIVKLEPAENDRLFGMTIFDNEEAAIGMAKDLHKDGTEVTDEVIIKQLPPIDGLGSHLIYYNISQLGNTVVAYKVVKINILKSKITIKWEV